MSKRVCEIETVTPKQAALILNANEGNRPLRDGRVDELERTLREGRWKLTNDAIAMTGTSHERPGRLLNGQHRLWACVNANVPIVVLVLYGLHEDSYAVMDTGAKRKASDLLPGPNQNIRKAATHCVFCYAREALSCSGYGLIPGNDEIESFYSGHPIIGETVDADLSEIKSFVRAPSGVVGGFVIIREDDRAAADEFIRGVLSGENLPKTAPEMVLRNRLIAESTRSSKLAPATYAAMTVKAYNAKRTNAPLGKIGFRDGESFPRVVVLSSQPPRVQRRINQR